jgi:hypothetical protein
MTFSIDVDAFKSFLSAASEFRKRFSLDEIIPVQPQGDNLIYASMDPGHVMLIILKVKVPPVLPWTIGLNVKEALATLKDLEGYQEIRVIRDQDELKHLIIGGRKVPLINVSEALDLSILDQLERHYATELATAEISYQGFEDTLDILKHFKFAVFKVQKHETYNWEIFRIEADNGSEKYIKELLSGRLEKSGDKDIVQSRYTVEYLRIIEKILNHVAKGRKHLADIKIKFATGKPLRLDLETYPLSATIYIAPRGD